MPLSPNLRGAFFMALAMMSFTFNDSLVKLMSETMPMGEIVFARNLIASAVIIFIAYRARALRPLREAANPWIGLRVLGEVGGTITFLIGLNHVPIAIATAIMQALPLAVTVGAALFLAEPVGWRRWAAIIAGFIGVLIIIRPGTDGFSPFSLMFLITIVFAASRDLATRKIGSKLPPLFISSLTAPAVALSGLLITPPIEGAWVAISFFHWFLLIAAAGLILVAYHFVILAMNHGDISFVAPFRYSSFLFAILLGFLMFGDIPDLYMWIGGLIIVASGLYTLYRERVRLDAREIAATAPPRHTP